MKTAPIPLPYHILFFKYQLKGHFTHAVPSDHHELLILSFSEINTALSIMLMSAC